MNEQNDQKLEEIVGTIIGLDYYDLVSGGKMTGYLIKTNGGKENKYMNIGDWYKSPKIGDRVRILSDPEKTQNVHTNSWKIYNLDKKLMSNLQFRVIKDIKLEE